MTKLGHFAACRREYEDRHGPLLNGVLVVYCSLPFNSVQGEHLFRQHVKQIVCCGGMGQEHFNRAVGEDD